MKKVIFLLEDFSSGGVETAFVNFVNYANLPEKCDASVVVWGTDDFMLDKLDCSKIKIVRIKRAWIDRIFNAVKKLGRIPKIEGLHNYIVKFLLICKLYKMPFDTLVNFHYPRWGKPFMWINKKFENILWYHSGKTNKNHFTKREHKRIDKVVLCCDECKEFMKEVHPDISDRLYVVENIIPADDIISKSDISEKLFSGGTFNIVTCARISVEKGIDIAVEACKILKNRIPDFKWYIIGDDTTQQEEFLKNKVKEYSLEDNFIFLGEKENPYPYFKQCDLYVQPSREESFGLAMAEAMVCNALVVSTNTVGGRYLIKDRVTGMISSITAEGVADAIYEVYSNKELQQSLKDNLKKLDFNELNKKTINKLYDLLGV